MTRKCGCVARLCCAWRPLSHDHVLYAVLLPMSLDCSCLLLGLLLPLLSHSPLAADIRCFAQSLARGGFSLTDSIAPARPPNSPCTSSIDFSLFRALLLLALLVPPEVNTCWCKCNAFEPGPSEIRLAYDCGDSAMHARDLANEQYASAYFHKAWMLFGQRI